MKLILLGLTIQLLPLNLNAGSVTALSVTELLGLVLILVGAYLQSRSDRAFRRMQKRFRQSRVGNRTSGLMTDDGAAAQRDCPVSAGDIARGDSVDGDGQLRRNRKRDGSRVPRAQHMLGGKDQGEVRLCFGSCQYVKQDGGGKRPRKG